MSKGNMSGKEYGMAKKAAAAKKVAEKKAAKKKTGSPANPATKGSAMGIEKKAAGMANRLANKKAK